MVMYNSPGEDKEKKKKKKERKNPYAPELKK